MDSVLFFCGNKSVVWKGENMDMDFKVIDNYLMIKMPAEVDHHLAGTICKKADAFLMNDKVSNIVFDFEETKFMDSSGIGIIVGRYKKISYLGGKVFAVHVDSQIRRILYISGLNKVIEVLD